MVNLILDRNTFFPGNIVTGRVENNNTVNVQIKFTCELYQHWTTTSTHTTGSGKNRRTRTVTHHHRKLTPIANMIIPVDPATGRLQFQLDYGCVPSLDIEKCRVRYYLTAIDSGSPSPPVPFIVLAPMQANQWQANTSRNEHREADVVCCCCCDKGRLKADFFISKTSLSLDRDKPTIVATIDNTASEADIDNFIVMLHASGRTKMGKHLTFSVIAGMTRVPANVKAGEKKTIEATIDLRPTSTPSIRSSVCDINYHITASLEMSWASNISATFGDVQVAHSVDPNSFNFQAAWQNTNFYNPDAENLAPMMYQQPSMMQQQQQQQYDPNNNYNNQQQQPAAAFEMLPPDVFTQAPELKFENWNENQQGQNQDQYEQKTETQTKIHDFNFFFEKNPLFK